MEPATRVERATCGLRIPPNTASDNLNPQETTKEDFPDMGGDRARLSCPGSSVVAGSGRGNSELNPLIKSPVESLHQDTQQKESPTNGEDL